MSDASGQELPSSEKPFRVSSYLDGTFQPDGTFTREALLSPEAVAVWEDENRRLAQGKLWGAGQALFFVGRPITFGRNTDAVDVKVDADPGPGGSYRIEQGVSRRHFLLQPPQDKRILIEDLGSTNGVRVLEKSGELKTELNRNNPTTNLEVGDFTLFGGGETTDPVTGIKSNSYSRLIGFRVCEDSQGKIFLVKFNAQDLDDILGLSGKTRADFPQTVRGEQPTNPTVEISLPTPEREAVAAAYQILLEDIGSLRRNMEEHGANHPNVLTAHRILFTDLFTQVERLGARFFNGDWNLAAGLIGKMAMDEAQKLLDSQKGREAEPAADLSMLAFDLINGRLVRFTKS